MVMVMVLYISTSNQLEQKAVCGRIIPAIINLRMESTISGNNRKVLFGGETLYLILPIKESLKYYIAVCVKKFSLQKED